MYPPQGVYQEILSLGKYFLSPMLLMVTTMVVVMVMMMVMNMVMMMMNMMIYI